MKKQKNIDPTVTKPPKRPTVQLNGEEVSLKRKPYRGEKEPCTLQKSHIVFLSVVAALMAGYFGWFGRWSFVRLGQSLYALAVSLAEYFISFFVDTDFLPVPVNDIPSIPYVPFLPLDSSDLSGFFGRFGTALTDSATFAAYNVSVGQLILRLYRLILPLVAFAMCASLVIGDSADIENDDFGYRTPGVRRLQTVRRKLLPVRAWFSDLVAGIPLPATAAFIGLFLAGTNLLTVCVSALALLFHFSVSFDVLGLWKQIYKLALDLTVAYDTLPLPVWLIIGYILLGKIRRALAYQKLDSMEAKIRDFIEDLPLCVLITGKIGIGKTQMNVNLTLTMQDVMRERMQKSMTEIQAEFPEYPWECLDEQIGIMYFCGDLPSKAATREIFKESLSESYDLFFGYAGTTTFTDGVTVSYLADRIVDYAELQYMYRVQCLVSSSYSMRVDSLYVDKGKLPAWTSDYFRTPPYDPHGAAVRAHVLDFDTLRLGKTFTEGNAGAWEFGVLSHTEMGKDFGNALTNKDLKTTDAAANIKNDMLIERIKILRHSSTACFTPYCQYIGDEQRPTSLTADVLDLCDVLRLKESSKGRTVYPFLTSESFFVDWILSVFAGWYHRRRVNRADTDVPTYLLRRLVSFVYPRYRERMQLFGYQEVRAELLDGSDMEAEPREVKLFVPFKKVRAGRYATDCLQDVLAARSAASDWEFDLSPSYAGAVATEEETEAGHSYFGRKMLRIRRVGSTEEK